MSAAPPPHDGEVEATAQGAPDPDEAVEASCRDVARALRARADELVAMVWEPLAAGIPPGVPSPEDATAGPRAEPSGRPHAPQ